MKNWRPNVRNLYRIHPRRSRSVINASPPIVLAGGFACLILLGTLLLKLPFATVTPIDWLQALFTATSAVTVTGLVVVDTGTQFTHAGQVIIAMLIQAGGLGFMTFAVVAALSLAGRLGVRGQVMAQEAFNQTSLAQVGRIAKGVLLFAFTIELIGFVLLTLVWWPEQGLGQAAFNGFFYVISAFNNAGFALSSDSLMAYVGHIPVNLIITGLFIVGGLGFVVLLDIYDNRRWSKLSVYTKAIILTTLIVNLVAFVLMWLLESNNPATLAGKPWSTQIMGAWFQAVTPRTAGFNTLDTSALTEASSLLTIFLMFIGGGSMSTAGGIKLGTFIVLMVATYAFLRRREHVTLLRRTVPPEMVVKALAVSMIMVMLAFIGVFALAVLERADFIDVVFEVVSALGTVGLSRGLTGDLSAASQCVIMLLMFSGRIGAVTLAYFLATPQKRHVRYPKMDIQVG
ncbi:TrkH family potassium uptake protein [Idiomarina xiamenensis]|uniref:K+ uptake system protein n=1 Tax=Idiomarina xiamenensis 10-D-4 TaxID=740709 RepID=K2L0J8_9GAMM|nr:TrkH family potassium uptake protein [Idiomarina xiamenensis]EKE83445.1 K+ uptake system protein [Idiomarina xiamenensis 10-D-4]